VHPEDRQFVDTQVRAALEQSQPYGIDHRIVRLDGSVRYVHEQERYRVIKRTSAEDAGTVQDITSARNTKRISSAPTLT